MFTQADGEVTSLTGKHPSANQCAADSELLAAWFRFGRIEGRAKMPLEPLIVYAFPLVILYDIMFELTCKLGLEPPFWC